MSDIRPGWNGGIWWNAYRELPDPCDQFQGLFKAQWSHSSPWEALRPYMRLPEVRLALNSQSNYSISQSGVWFGGTKISDEGMPNNIVVSMTVRLSDGRLWHVNEFFVYGIRVYFWAFCNENGLTITNITRVYGGWQDGGTWRADGSQSVVKHKYGDVMGPVISRSNEMNFNHVPGDVDTMQLTWLSFAPEVL